LRRERMKRNCKKEKGKNCAGHVVPRWFVVGWIW
jgi:hypothetical protein